MGSFLQEIIKGGLGNVIGGSSTGSSGGLGDIIKDVTGATQKTSATNSGSIGDIVKNIRKNAGATGDAPQRTSQQADTNVATSKTTKKTQTDQEQASGIDMGDVTNILLGQGVNIGNLGSIAKGILKTIGLAGNSVK